MSEKPPQNQGGFFVDYRKIELKKATELAQAEFANGIEQIRRTFFKRPNAPG